MPMRRPSILDVLEAVTTVAPAHPEVRAWWYVPAARIMTGAVAGEAPGEPGRPVELVVEPRDGAEPDPSAIATELSDRLWRTRVAVRVRTATAEGEALYRLISRER